MSSSWEAWCSSFESVKEVLAEAVEN